MTKFENIPTFYQALIRTYWQLLDRVDLGIDIPGKPLHNNTFIHYCYEEWPLSGNITHDYTQLNISSKFDDMISTYKKNGVIELRTYNGEKKLLVGCGNYPFVNCGGYPFQNNDEEKKYHEMHHHTDSYTINPMLSYNPSVIGFYSYNTFKNIPSQSFEKIIIEGVRLDETQIFASETLRLLEQDGVVTLSNHENIDILIRRNNSLKLISRDGNEIDYDINKFDIFDWGFLIGDF